MTDEERQQIRERVNVALAVVNRHQSLLLLQKEAEYIPALLAEVDRLRARFEEVIALIQEARNVSRPEHFSETADNILIRAINAARVAQQGD